MAVSINCKNNPCRPSGGRQAPVAQAVGDRDLSVKFFIFKWIPGGDATTGGAGRRAGRPSHGRQGRSPVPRATG